MRLRKALCFQRQLDKRGMTILSTAYFQTWWVVEKCVKGPESGNTLCDTVGILRSEAKDLPKPYRQTPVLILTTSQSARGGIALNWKPLLSLGEMHYLKLSPIDFKHEVFPGFD